MRTLYGIIDAQKGDKNWGAWCPNYGGTKYLDYNPRRGIERRGRGGGWNTKTYLQVLNRFKIISVKQGREEDTTHELNLVYYFTTCPTKSTYRTHLATPAMQNSRRGRDKEGKYKSHKNGINT